MSIYNQFIWWEIYNILFDFKIILIGGEIRWTLDLENIRTFPCRTREWTHRDRSPCDFPRWRGGWSCSRSYRPCTFCEWPHKRHNSSLLGFCSGMDLQTLRGHSTKPNLSPWSLWKPFWRWWLEFLLSPWSFGLPHNCPFLLRKTRLSSHACRPTWHRCPNQADNWEMCHGWRPPSWKSSSLGCEGCWNCHNRHNGCRSHTGWVEPPMLWNFLQSRVSDRQF